MKLTGLILSFCMLSVTLPAQYFFTGEVKDPHGDKLQNGYITVLSTHSSYRTGFFGEFGINSRKIEDSLTFSFEGYEPYTTGVSAKDFLQVTLKRKADTGDLKKNYLRSVFNGNISLPPPSGVSQGAYRHLLENPFIDQSASVSFPGTIDRGSYGMIKRFLDMGSTVPPDAVQIEEMLDYYNLYYEDPEKENVFHCSSDLLTCPWNRSHKLLCLNICARKVNIQKAPPGNFVFLMDASGSMDMPNKLPMVKSGIRLLIQNLRPVDTVSVIEFGGRVRARMVGIPGSEKARILKAMEELTPDGPTPGVEGVKMAYAVARRQFIPGGNNRIILVTDGDITESAVAEKELEDFIGQQSEGGITLSCVAVGMGGYTNSSLPELAKKGLGSLAYADNEPDAEKALAGQLGQNLFTVADSVIITTDFDSVLVKEYRLIGFDNKRVAAGDSVSGLGNCRIGSGHSLLALFELVPKKDSVEIENVAAVKISYRLPGQSSAKGMSYSCPNKLVPFERAGSNLKRSACIAMFGMKLRESGYLSQTSWMDLEKIAKKSFAGNDLIDKEYLTLISRAKTIYAHSKPKNE